MSAGQALQAAIVAAIGEMPGLNGVYDGPPARAAYPYVTLDCSAERSWGAKGVDGREVIAAVTLWDDEPARLYALGEAIEAAAAGAGPVAGWQAMTMVMSRRRVMRDVAGPWALMIDWRVRLVAA